MTAAWFSTRCCVCVIKIHIKSFYDRLLINSHLLSLLQFSKQCNVHGGKVKWHFVVSIVRLSRVPKGCDNLAKKGALPRRPRTPDLSRDVAEQAVTRPQLPRRMPDGSQGNCQQTGLPTVTIYVYFFLDKKYWFACVLWFNSTTSHRRRHASLPFLWAIPLSYKVKGFFLTGHPRTSSGSSKAPRSPFTDLTLCIRYLRNSVRFSFT